MWGPDWLAMLRVRILRKMQGMRSTSEYSGMHGNVGFVEILGTAKHVEFLRNTSELRGKRLTCCIRSNTSELQGHET